MVRRARGGELLARNRGGVFGQGQRAVGWVEALPCPCAIGAVELYDVSGVVGAEICSRRGVDSPGFSFPFFPNYLSTPSMSFFRIW